MFGERISIGGANSAIRSQFSQRSKKFIPPKQLGDGNWTRPWIATPTPRLLELRSTFGRIKRLDDLPPLGHLHRGMVKVSAGNDNGNIIEYFAISSDLSV
jgi:hypothetical protein